MNALTRMLCQVDSTVQKEDGAEKPRPTLSRSFSGGLVASVWKSSKRLDLSRDWRRDRDSVDKKMRYCRAYKAVAAFVGVRNPQVSSFACSCRGFL